MRKAVVDGKEREVWALKEKEWEANDSAYLTVNAATLEPKQEGFDLREWTEKGWIAYYDYSGDHEDQMGVPHPGDMY